MSKWKLLSNSLLINWIFKYTAVIALSFAAASFVYQNAISALGEENARTYSILLGSIQKNIEGRLLDAINLGNQIYTNDTFKALAFSRDMKSISHIMSLTELNNVFNSYKSANTSIQYFFAYFNNTGRALTTEGYFDRERLYTLISGNADISREELEALLSRYHSRSFYIVGDANANLSKTKIFFLQSFSVGTDRSVEATIVVVLDGTNLIDITGTGIWNGMGAVAVADENGTVLGEPDYFDFLQDSVLSEQFPGEEGEGEMELHGESYSVAYASSGFTGWKYILMMPQSVIMEKINTFTQTAGIGIFLCLLAGGGAALYFAFSNYKPIKKMVVALSASDEPHNRAEGANTARKEHEISYIHGRIATIINEKLLMRNELNEKNMALRDRFVESLLKGKRMEEALPGKRLADYGLHFTHEYYAVILIRVDDFGDFCDGTEDERQRQDKGLAAFALRNVLEEIFRKRFAFCLTEMDGMMAMVINAPKPAEAVTACLPAIEAVRGFMSKNFNLIFSAAVSGICQSVSGIEEACQQAYKTMEYSFVRGLGETLLYEDILLSDDAYDYSIETEQKLANHIKTGEAAEAKKVVEAIFDENITRRTLSSEMVKCLVFDMVSTIIKVFHELRRDSARASLDAIMPLELFFHCATLEETKGQMFRILEEICECVEFSKKSHNTGLKDQIVAYVHRHYSDMNLSVGGIADQLGVNSKYMSRLFKEQAGCPLVEYIGRIRLKKVRELMEAEDMTIAEIAQKAGFYNAVALIRTFKKYEGITPGKYKEYIRSTSN